MILDLSKDGKLATVTAFKTPSGIDPSVALMEMRSAFPNADVQFLEGAQLAGKEHLEIAATNALHAFKTGLNISRNLAMEVLLYASAQRQIDVAIRMLGVKPDSKTVGLVAFSDSRDEVESLQNRMAQFLKTDLDDALLDDWSSSKASVIEKRYGIENSELDAIKMPGQPVKEAVQKAVIERVALLSTRT